MTFGGCFSSRGWMRVRIPATFWTQQKSLPFADERGRPLDCVPFCLLSGPGVPLPVASGDNEVQFPDF